jgi:uncharacterized protein YidB (DUF937 family)
MNSVVEGTGETRGADAGSLLGPGGKHAGIVQALMDSQGGLGGLLGHLKQGGLAAAVGSWIGTGTNQPVTAEQVHAALPPEVVNQIAGKLGIEPTQVSSGLAHVLPGLVDELSPSGSLPQGSGLHSALGGLLGSIMGKKS